MTYADDDAGRAHPPGADVTDHLIEHFASAARSYRTDRLVLWRSAA